MDAVDVIRTKRNGGRLSDEEIDWFIDAYTNDKVPDYQASALLMAIVCRGMEPVELARWTERMILSGRRMKYADISAVTADKHSTGGVGDKVSLPLAPIIAACGLVDPMLSGRGLGHTGGTLDKLESIPGFRVNLAPDEVAEVLRTVGCVIYSAGDDVAPADRKLYALRDVTGTVESVPLIASSIMSKKIAEGTDVLVLDVKVGSGAFLPDLDTARRLAETMVGLGEAHGVKTSALLTNMEHPLGRTAGNAMEVRESVAFLEGDAAPDLAEVTFALAEEMLDLAGVEADPRDAVASGAALKKWTAMVEAQGGDPHAALPEANERHTVTAQASGYVTKLSARAVGLAAWRLGAGRARKEDPVRFEAGVVSLAKPGDAVEEGQPLLQLHTDQPDRFDHALKALEDGYKIGPEAPEPTPMIIDRIRP